MLETIDPGKVKVRTEAEPPLLQDTPRYCEASVLELERLSGASYAACENNDSCLLSTVVRGGPC